MHHYFNALINADGGDALIGYFVRAIDRTTNTAIAMYSDEGGTPIVGVSGVADAAKSDNNGNVSFYVNPGTYHLDIYDRNSTGFMFRVPDVGMTSNKGDAATIQVGTVTTLAPGTSATVTNSGTTTAAVLDFALPQGPQSSVIVNGLPITVVPCVADGVTDDVAVINNTLADPAVSVAMLPAGTIMVSQSILIPANKQLIGAGRGRTIVKIASNFSIVDNQNNAIGSVSGAANVSVSNLSVDGSKLNTTGNAAGRLNGVRLTAVDKGLVANVHVYNTTGYNFYTQGATSSNRNCRNITFFNCRAENGNVLFEQQFSENITLIGCYGAPGDGDISHEAVFHPQFAQHVKFIGCHGYCAAGSVVNIIGDGAVPTTDITFTDCWLEHLGPNETSAIVAQVGVGSKALRFANCDIVSQGSTVISLGNGWSQVTFVGTRIERSVNSTLGRALLNLGDAECVFAGSHLKISNSSTGTVECGSGSATARYIGCVLEAYSGGVANATSGAAYYDPSCRFVPTPANVVGGFGPNLINTARFIDSGASASTVDGRHRITNTVTFGGVALAFPTVIGKTYRVRWVSITGDSTPSTRISNASDGSSSIFFVNAQYPNGRTIEFEATATTTYFCARNNNAGVGLYHDIENISVQEKL